MLGEKKQKIFSQMVPGTQLGPLVLFGGLTCRNRGHESPTKTNRPTLNTWDLIHLPDPKIAVCVGRAWFRYLSFREVLAQLSPHFRGFRAICDVGGTTCWCAYMKMHFHNITCNFILHPPWNSLGTSCTHFREHKVNFGYLGPL